jgi:hypothetical protein
MMFVVAICALFASYSFGWSSVLMFLSGVAFGAAIVMFLVTLHEIGWRF